MDEDDLVRPTPFTHHQYELSSSQMLVLAEAWTQHMQYDIYNVTSGQSNLT